MHLFAPYEVLSRQHGMGQHGMGISGIADAGSFPDVREERLEHINYEGRKGKGLKCNGSKALLEESVNPDRAVW
jgi:hypothetical protein